MGDGMNPVDEFVKEKVPPDFHDIVAMLRKLMRECAPHATEKISYGLPMWIGRSTLAWISPAKQHITFGFTFGSEFDDKHGLLQGKGKHARNVRIKELAEANREALRHYIQQAVEHDAK